MSHFPVKLSFIRVFGKNKKLYTFLTKNFYFSLLFSFTNILLHFQLILYSFKNVTLIKKTSKN